ncbi:hypothetical protein ACWCPT_15365 [Streptomyces sp. NPDC002308]
MAPQPKQPERPEQPNRPERSGRPLRSGPAQQGDQRRDPSQDRESSQGGPGSRQPNRGKRTKTSRLADGRLLIADIDLELPPGRSPLQRALRTADINLPPARSRTGVPTEAGGPAGEAGKTAPVDGAAAGEAGSGG